MVFENDFLAMMRETNIAKNNAVHSCDGNKKTPICTTLENCN
jgi:hypothetical protein